MCYHNGTVRFILTVVILNLVFIFIIVTVYCVAVVFAASLCVCHGVRCVDVCL